jgi:hypothetical protein
LDNLNSFGAVKRYWLNCSAELEFKLVNGSSPYYITSYLIESNNNFEKGLLFHQFGRTPESWEDEQKLLKKKERDYESVIRMVEFKETNADICSIK